jgi:hypothetical protein
MNILAHANGTGWDEIVLTTAPLLLSLTIFIAAKRRPASSGSSNSEVAVD